MSYNQSQVRHRVYPTWRIHLKQRIAIALLLFMLPAAEAQNQPRRELTLRPNREVAQSKEQAAVLMACERTLKPWFQTTEEIDTTEVKNELMVAVSLPDKNKPADLVVNPSFPRVRGDLPRMEVNIKDISADPNRLVADIQNLLRQAFPAASGVAKK